MSEEQGTPEIIDQEGEVVDRLEAVAKDVPAEEATEAEQPQMTLADLKVGFVSGLTKDGDFVFEVFGQEPTLIEMMGLLAYADKRINRLFEEKQFYGDKLTDEVGKAVAVLKQQLDQVLAQIMPPKKPDNQL